MGKDVMEYTKTELERIKYNDPKRHAKILAERKHKRHVRGKEKSKSWGKTNPDKAARSIRNANYKRKYGITLQEYEDMHTKQEGLCAICNRPETMLGHKGTLVSLAVDHCHKTGKIRALLCRNCNTMLGGSRDNIDILLNAIRYLKEHHDD